MMKAVTTEEMREIDRRAREEFGIPELILMEHAGTAVARTVFRWLRRHKKKTQRGSVLVFSGGGANGGDGFVAARHLDSWGLPVEVMVVSDPHRIRGASQVNLDVLKRLGVPIAFIRSSSDWTKCIRKKRSGILVIDALLGTGLRGRVREPYRTVIRWMNQQASPIVSVDIPSGLSSDVGLPCGITVKASMTVTCGFPKVGFQKGVGPRVCGRVQVADIGLPKLLRRWNMPSCS